MTPYDQVIFNPGKDCLILSCSTPKWVTQRSIVLFSLKRDLFKTLKQIALNFDLGNMHWKYWLVSQWNMIEIQRNLFKRFNVRPPDIDAAC